MKKAVVIILVVLALIVMITPGVIGHLAEQSLDENLEYAADESNELILTSSSFDGGWFVSEGQHSFELGRGELRRSLMDFGLPPDMHLNIIIDTRLDHGLIPISSMSRDHGTLAPGLGNAVSTVSLEVGGETITFPGTFYSHVGVTGVLESRMLLSPGNADLGDAKLNWNDVDLTFLVDAAAQRFGVEGRVEAFAMDAGEETLVVGPMDVDIVQTVADYGLLTGPASMQLESFSLTDAQSSTEGGPVTFWGDGWITDDGMDIELGMSYGGLPLMIWDETSAGLEMRMVGLAPEPLSRLQTAADLMDENSADIPPGFLEAAADLFIAGFEVHFDELTFDLAGDKVLADLHIEFAEADRNDFSWTGVLLTSSAEGKISVPAPVMETLLEIDENMQFVVGMGYLTLKDGEYVSEVSLAEGVLTINDAPTPLAPLLGVSN